MNSNNNIWNILLRYSLGMILALSFLLVKMKFGWDPIKELASRGSSYTNNTSILIDSIIIKEDSMEIMVNDTRRLMAQIMPANAENQKLYWHSNDTTVAYVDSTGLVTATSKGGRCIISVNATDCSNKSDSVIIKVGKPVILKPVTDVKVETINILNSKGEISLKLGSVYKVDFEVLPKNASNKLLKWKSDNNSVATVDDDGTIRAKGTGDCVISVTSTDGSNISPKTIKVRVPLLKPQVVKVTSIMLDKSNITINVGDRHQVYAKVNPPYATNNKLAWKSTKESVAVVENGVIIGKGAGTCKIIVSSTDEGNASPKTINVKVQQVIGKTTLEETLKSYLLYFSNSTNTASKKAKAKKMYSLFAPDASIIIRDGSVIQKETKTRIGIWASSRMRVRYISHKVNISGLITELTVEEDL